ncbi:MAG: DUF3040 domain-containing protein [Ilumatobacteraceae bacterium]
MPLSEDEQRILRQIEEQLQRDPGFGRTIDPSRPGDRRSFLLASIGTVLCLVLTIGLLGVSPYLSFVAFAAAVVCALVVERQLRSIGEAGLQSLSESMRHRFPPGQRSDD